MPPQNYGVGSGGGGGGGGSQGAMAIINSSPPRAPHHPNAGPQPGMSLQEKQSAAVARHNDLGRIAKVEAESKARTKAEAEATNHAATALPGPNAGKKTDLDHFDSLFAPAVGSQAAHGVEDFALTESSGTESEYDDDDGAAAAAANSSTDRGVNITQQANTVVDTNVTLLQQLANTIAEEGDGADDEVVEGFGFDPEDMSSPNPPRAPRRSTMAQLDLIHMPEMMSVFIPAEFEDGHEFDEDMMMIDQARLHQLAETGKLASFSQEVQDKISSMLAAPHRVFTEDEVIKITMDLESAMEEFTNGMPASATATSTQQPSPQPPSPQQQQNQLDPLLSSTGGTASNFSRSNNYTLTEPLQAAGPSAAFAATTRGGGGTVGDASAVPALLLKGLSERLFTMFDDDLEGGEDTTMSQEDVQMIADNVQLKLDVAAIKALLVDSGISSRMGRNVGGGAAGAAAAEGLQNSVIRESQRQEGCTLQLFMQMAMQAAAISQQPATLPAAATQPLPAAPQSNAFSVTANNQKRRPVEVVPPPPAAALAAPSTGPQQECTFLANCSCPDCA